MVESFNTPPTTVGTAVVLQLPRQEENNESIVSPVASSRLDAGGLEDGGEQPRRSPHRGRSLHPTRPEDGTSECDKPVLPPARKPRCGARGCRWSLSAWARR